MYRDIWCIHAWDKLKHTKESFCLLPIIPFLLLTFSHKIPLWRSQVWKKNSHTLSPPQNIFGLSPYPLDVQFCFIVSFKMFVLTPQPPHPLWIFNGPFWLFFCIERLIVAEEFYSENLKTALKSGKAFRWVFILKSSLLVTCTSLGLKKLPVSHWAAEIRTPKVFYGTGILHALTAVLIFFFFNSFHTAKWVLHSRLSIHK